MKRLLLFLLPALCLTAACASAPEEKAAADLARRIVPAYAGKIRFVKTADTTDVFELRTRGKHLVVKGNSALSMAVGLHYYLKNYCLATVSWYASDPVECPAEMPRVDGTVRVKALVRDRFFLNYCTFGYTLPWWGWEEWERLIDWMALNGVNLPLATTGQEAIWQRIWRRHGMTDSQIRSYFTGPAHLPWHRMCNIDGVDAPLPQSWIDAQEALQGRILERERSLGMTPVLPAFNGHVPAALKELHPEAAITDVGTWGGFESAYQCHFLSPADSLFPVIQREYLAEQERLWGTDHLYGMDLFNEVDAPSWEPEVLADMARRAYGSLSAVDPDARWLQMGWMFHYDRRHWTEENVRAYLKAVPAGRVLVLDYYTEHTPVWTLTERFHGQPYLFCYLGNFGGNTRISGSVQTLSERLSDALRDGGNNLCGVGATLEGFGINAFQYEYLFDRAWETGLSDEEWIRRLADRRTGRVDPDARAAWKQLTDSCYVHGAISEGPLICGRPCLEGWWHWTVIHKLFYDNASLLRAWDLLLGVDAERDSFRHDLVVAGSQYLANGFALLRDRLTDAFRSGNRQEAGRIAGEMRALLEDVDRLCACVPEFRLDNWLTAAASFGTTPEEAAYYRRNARHILTTWGFSRQLKDYGSRLWSGLVSSYYAPRWNLFLDEILSCMEEGRPFDQDELDRRIDLFETQWVEGAFPAVSPPATEDVRLLCRTLRDKYAVIFS